MHWISLIAFCMIINLCRAQPTGFQPSENANSNKDISFNLGSDGVHVGVAESKNDAGNFVYTTSTTVPTESTTKVARSVVKSASNGSDNNRCYVMFPIFLATLMMIIRF